MGFAQSLYFSTAYISGLAIFGVYILAVSGSFRRSVRIGIQLRLELPRCALRHSMYPFLLGSERDELLWPVL